MSKWNSFDEYEEVFFRRVDELSTDVQIFADFVVNNCNMIKLFRTEIPVNEWLAVDFWEYCCELATNELGLYKN